MSKVSYTENFNLTQYSEVDEPVFLNDITRDNALIDSALQNGKETAENAVSIANTAKDTADYAKSVADGVASDLQVTNQNVASLDARVTQNEADIALLQPAKITALENKIDANTGLINALSNELDSVEAEVDAHGNRLDALESATGQLRTDVDTLRSDFDGCCTEVRAHLETLDTEQGVQNGRLDSLETRMDSAETRLDNLETEDETITGQVTVLTDRVNQLLSDLDPTNIQSALALTQQVIQNKNDIATLVSDVTALGEQAGNETLITTAQTLSGAINELAGASVVVDSQLDATSEHAVQNKVLTGIIGTDTLTTVAQTITGALNELKSALDTVDSRETTHYTNLSSGVSGLNSRVGALETAVGGANSGLVKDVADLQASMTTAQTDIDALEVAVGDANSGLVKGVADNADAIAGLETVVGDSSAGLVKDVADNADDISALQSTVGDSSSGLVKDVDDLTVDVNALETAVGDANSGLTKRVGDVETAVGALETTVGDANSGLVKDVDDLQATVGDSSAGLVKDVADNASAISTLEGTVGDSSSGLVKNVDDLQDDAEYEKWVTLGTLNQQNYNTYRALADAFYPLLSANNTDWTEYDYRIVVIIPNQLTQIYSFSNCNQSSGFFNFNFAIDAGANGIIQYALSVTNGNSYWHSFECRESSGAVTWSYNDLINNVPQNSATWCVQRRKLRH